MPTSLRLQTGASSVSKGAVGRLVFGRNRVEGVERFPREPGQLKLSNREVTLAVGCYRQVTDAMNQTVCSGRISEGRGKTVAIIAAVIIRSSKTSRVHVINRR